MSSGSGAGSGSGSGDGRLVAPHEVVERALAAASSSGSAGCVVIVEDSTQAEVRFADNTTTTNGMRRSRRVAVVSFRRHGDGAVSVASASASGAVDVEELFARADADAATSPPAEDAVDLLEPGAGAAAAAAAAAAGSAGTGGAGAGFDAPPAHASPAVLDGVVGGLADAFGRARAAGTVLSGFATHRVGSQFVGTSTGLRLRHDQPEGSMELVARSGDGTRSAWSGTGTSWDFDVELDVFEDRLRQRLAWAQRRVDLPAGRYEVLLPPDATADLMVAMAEDLSGRDAEDGRNVFSAKGGGTRIGDSLSAVPFVLRSNPFETGIECAPFVATMASSTDVSVFDNGMAVPPVTWIADGRLERLRYSRAAAARSGAVVTPPFDNLVLEAPGATATLEEMIASTERGLLLTCLWYIREVDPVTQLLTGLTRDGVYLVEKGEVVGAVNNFRFNESPLDVLARTLEVGRSERALSREWGEWLNRTVMPPLRVADFNMSSVSQAT